MRYILYAYVVMASVLGFSKSKHVGLFSSLSGTVNIKRGNASQVAALGSKVFQGDKILTLENSHAKILYRDNSMMEVKSSSELVIESVAVNEEKKSVFSLVFGKIRAIVGKRDADDVYEVKSEGLALGVRGTTFSLSICKNENISTCCNEKNISICQQELATLKVFSGLVSLRGLEKRRRT